MFDIGWTELLLIGIVALIVVGPKDLPGMFRTLGRFTARARQMGREFSRAMEEAAKESGVKDVADDLKAATSKKNMGLDALEQAADKFEKWKPATPSATPKGPATQALAERRAADAAAAKARAEEGKAARAAAKSGAETAAAADAAPHPAAPAASGTEPPKGEA